MNKEERRIGSIWIVSIISFLIIIYAIGGIMNDSIIDQENVYKCLSPIAKEYCEEKDMIFYKERVLSTRFYCYADERSANGEMFIFSKNETDNCKLYAKEVNDDD